MRWRELLWVHLRRTAVSPVFVAVANLLLEASPFRLLGVPIFLSRVAMIAARAPVAIANGFFLVASAAFTNGLPCMGLRSVRSRTFPASFALAETLRACGVTRFPQLASFEPSHHGRRMLLLQTVECWFELLGIMRTECRRLVVDDDGPIHMARGHDDMLRECSYS